MLYLFAIIFAFSYGGEASSRPLMVAELFGLRALGAIHGAVLLGLTTGGAIGPIVVGRIFDISNTYYLGFIVCAVLGIIGLILTLMLRPTKGKGEANDSRRSTQLG